ncbi:hypothetical protein LCGC14_0298390 [marine sediment metagenome]|uniref:10 kDa chaperonin n=1 Tax=marine sediment metagenome TaxID=412755 RepID=A0A0F9TW86_9ZZZZ
MPLVLTESEQILPMGPHVLIRRVDVEETTEGGIVLPDIAKQRPFRGTVVKVGQGRLPEKWTWDGENMPDMVPLSVAIGDDVIFKAYVGTEIRIDDEDYLLVDEADIYAVIE